MDTINNITKKQLEIITLLYRFRFLNRLQIQKLLNQKQKNRINYWLKDLYDKKIIGRNYSKKFGDNIKPAVYYLKTKSKTEAVQIENCLLPHYNNNSFLFTHNDCLNSIFSPGSKIELSPPK